MIILVTRWYDIYDKSGWPTGKKEFVTSHGICPDTGKVVVTPNDHPQRLGAIFDNKVGEWVIL